MKPSGLRKVLLKTIPARKPILIVGPPGIGKTSVVQQVCAELKVKLIIVHPVVDEPIDYKGMPIAFKDDGGRMIARFLPFGDLQLMIDATEPTVVFFDDLGQAPPAVQAALMQLVLARRINGHLLSDKVVFVAATNRREDKAGVVGLLSTLIDRFMVRYNLEFDLDDFVSWYLKQNLPPVVAAFARFRPDLIANAKPSRDLSKFSSPRAMEALGDTLNIGLDDNESVMGAVGDATGTEFRAFYKTWMELPSKEEIYLNPDTVDVSKKPDVLYATMAMLAHGATATNMESTVRYLNRCPKDFAVYCFRDMLSRNKALAKCKAFITWATKKENRAVFGYE